MHSLEQELSLLLINSGKYLGKIYFTTKILFYYGLSTRNYVVVLGDLNARVGDGELEGVVGKYGGIR